MLLAGTKCYSHGSKFYSLPTHPGSVAHIDQMMDGKKIMKTAETDKTPGKMLTIFLLNTRENCRVVV